MRGGIWVFGLRMGVRALGMARTIVLARVLAPDDFGLFGIALLALSTLQAFSETGLSAALVQRKGDTKPYLDTAWTVQLIRGIALAAIVVLAAPYVGAFFAAPAATPLLRVLALSLLVQGFTNVAVVYFQKELEFHKQFALYFTSAAVELIVAVSAAILLRSAWALIFGSLAGQLASTSMSYVVSPYRPRIAVEGSKIRELLGFGKWILGSTVLMFLVTQGDRAFVGKLLGVTALGLYQLAYRISNMPATEITHVITQVAFPTYSKLQDELDRLRRAYLRVLQLTAYVSTPVAVLIFVLAGDVTSLLLGEKWMPMVPALRILVVAGYLRSLQATTGPAFMGLGRADIDTKAQMIRLLVLATALYPFAVWWGVEGAAAAVVLSTFACLVWSVGKAIQMGVCGTKALVKAVSVPAANAALMASATYFCGSRLGSYGMVQLTSLAGAAVLVYAGATLLLDRFSGYAARSLVRGSCAALRGT